MLIFGISIPILVSILIHGMLVCIASSVINLYLHLLLLIISIVLLYSCTLVSILLLIHYASIEAPNKFKVSSFFFSINPLVSPSPSLKAFVVFIKRNQSKHGFVASSSKIIANKGVNCLIFTSKSTLP